MSAKKIAAAPANLTFNILQIKVDISILQAGTKIYFSFFIFLFSSEYVTELWKSALDLLATKYVKTHLVAQKI